eukprot:CAMPEP_0115350434 /NCGR_PEP_ID=MMETSP0270-20121206/96463_1 /TAXON_ID=71861 /ORGANISM="Scrippsiella trochoidea, Strain CCMP3099" /LENGTH=159 /DNA_ID=CAMNT_0002772525 /DNA_START=127 /DNA_END=606 /DNA_ORIENTATION=+
MAVANVVVVGNVATVVVVDVAVFVVVVPVAVFVMLVLVVVVTVVVFVAVVLVVVVHVDVIVCVVSMLVVVVAGSVPNFSTRRNAPKVVDAWCAAASFAFWIPTPADNPCQRPMLASTAIDSVDDAGRCCDAVIITTATAAIASNKAAKVNSFRSSARRP